jgi:plasmid stability protein
MATITLKNIPERLHNDIKKLAAMYHRSVNSEIIVCLENQIYSNRIDDDFLVGARNLRSRVSGKMNDKTLAKLKSEGRK